jgi:hypothetical protein
METSNSATLVIAALAGRAVEVAGQDCPHGSSMLPLAGKPIRGTKGQYVQSSGTLSANRPFCKVTVEADKIAVSSVAR